MKVRIIGKPGCKYCRLARRLAVKHDHVWSYVDIDKETNADYKNYLRVEGLNTVPQIWVDGKHIGGYTEYLHLCEELHG